jgi:myo-inositol-1(or 4)-monophosphatase
VEDFLAVGTAAARLAGQVLLDYQHKFTAREKSPRDLVTDADLAAQREIESFLRAQCPDHAFQGEESSAAEREIARRSGRPVWVVDPLDGTANYVHRLQPYAVSIALVQEQQVLVGVIYDPVADQLYTAARDGTALCNGIPLRASSCTDLNQAMVAASFAAGVKRDDPEVAQFLNVLENSQSIRRFGSAALTLCYLAQGSLDGYWASNVKAWDVAAGVLIAERAGVVLTGMAGEAFDVWNPRLVAAATGQLHARLLECIAVPG